MDSARCFLLSVAVTRSTFRVCVFVCAGVRELVRKCEMCDKKGTSRTYRCLRNKSLLRISMFSNTPAPRISMLGKSSFSECTRPSEIKACFCYLRFFTYFSTLKFGGCGRDGALPRKNATGFYFANTGIPKV